MMVKNLYFILDVVKNMFSIYDGEQHVQYYMMVKNMYSIHDGEENAPYA